MLTEAHTRPGELDDFTPPELEALMRDYEFRAQQDG